MKRHLLLAMLGVASLSAFADYEINFPDGTNQTKTNPARYLSGVKFSVGALPTQTLSVNQEAGGPLFIDLTSQCVVLVAGAQAKVDFVWEGNWMNSFVYLDRGNDGKFDATLTDDNLPAEESDIMSFSNLNNKNSVGGEAVDSRNILGNTMLLPEFTVPDLAPGLYRMRFKVDYSNVDPGGATEELAGEGKSCAQRGGAIADAMALVISPNTTLDDITLVANNGTLTLSDIVEGGFTVTGTPAEGYAFEGINVINELSAPEGVTFADHGIARSIKTLMTKTGEVALSLDDIFGKATIEGRFIDASGVVEYDTEYTGDKNATHGITSITFNDAVQTVATDKAHFFTNDAFNLPLGATFRMQARYNGSAKSFKVYVDTDQTGKFGEPLASGNTLTKIGEMRLPSTLKSGVYRARLEAVNDCEVDFLINVYNPTASYRPNALNGLILSGDGTAMGETVPTMTALSLRVLPTLPGFEVDTVIVRHGQNIYGPEFVAGNRQWSDKTLHIGTGGNVTVPADIVNGDICVYALFSETADSEWSKVWGDEFNGTEVDSKRWTYNPRYGAAWNRFMAQSAEQRAKVNIIKDGYYNSLCIPTPAEFTTETEPMISGALISSGRLQVCYGKIEARAKTNPFTGNFPAFWMMPAYSELQDVGLNGWPNDGEIDIWEQINAENAHHGTIHSGWTGWSTYNKWPEAPKQSSPESTCKTPSDATIWHVYALEWEADELRWYIDGKQVFSYANRHYSEPGSKYYIEKVTWPFDKQFYILVNQSVGSGSWADNPDTNHEYLTQFDYVRVYQKKGEGTIMNALGTNGDDPDFYVPATGKAQQSAIEAVELNYGSLEGAPAYYDLAGRRVDTGAMMPGIYIEQRGSKSQKIIIR